jgi:hypothetical protein
MVLRNSSSLLAVMIRVPGRTLACIASRLTLAYYVGKV